MAEDNTNKKTVELSQEILDALMVRLSEQEAKLKELESVQDNKTKNKIEELRRSGKLVKNVKLRTLDKNIVVGWKLVEDEVYFADGKLIEKQNVDVYFEGGKKKTLSMRQWATMPLYHDFEVIKEIKEEDGTLYFVVRREDGKELPVAVTYVN